MKEKDSSDDRLRAWKSASTITLLAAASCLLTNLGWYLVRGTTFWQWQMAAMVSIAGLTATRVFRSKPIWAAVSISYLVLGVALFANAFTNYQLAAKRIHFEAFTGFNLLSIAIAVIAPSPAWVGWFVIGFCAVAPMLIYYLVLTSEMRLMMPFQGPWISLIYAVVAFLVLRHRMKAVVLEQTMVRMKAERRALDDLARLFLGLRDLTNTPLQSIELTAGLLGTDNLTPGEGAKHLERSMVQLRELSQILTAYETDVDWIETESSFDAIVLLQNKIDEIKSR